MTRACCNIAKCLFVITVCTVRFVGAQTVPDPHLHVELYHQQFFQEATQLEFLGPDDLLITRQAGQITRLRNRTLTPVRTTLNVFRGGPGAETGLLGIELHPQFNINGYVYVYYSAAEGTAWKENRLSRLTWNGSSLADEVVLRVFASAADGQSQTSFHLGGPLAFGPDGKIYGATGEMLRSRAEQNNLDTPALSAFMGGIYRLNDDGSVPQNNPFANSSTEGFRPWYAYGVRNSYGVSFDPVTGKLWDTENGGASGTIPGYDEINLVAPGFNSGWKKIMGPLERNTNGVEDLVHLPGSAYSDPELSFGGAPTAIEFLASAHMWGPSYADAVLVAFANSPDSLRLLRLNAQRDGFVFTEPGLQDLVVDGGEGASLKFGQGFGSTLTDLQIGPDGAVYVLSYNGTVFRIVPEPVAICYLAFLGSILQRRRKTAGADIEGRSKLRPQGAALATIVVALPDNARTAAA